MSIKIEKTEIHGLEPAIRGMRNPMNSWKQSDTVLESKCSCFEADCGYKVFLGEKDIDLMKQLCKAGSDHRKYLRMITVYADITAPLYWFKEFDTYKIGTVANSCSTMHKIHAKEFTLDDFSYQHLSDFSLQIILQQTVDALNHYRIEYLRTKDKYNWWQMIQLLPSSYNQKRTVMLNYEVLRNIYFARRNHKLDEWHTMCDWIETLTYFREVCIDE